eukprot:jgi/Phyca11/122622/e_gw1.48.370.1
MRELASTGDDVKNQPFTFTPEKYPSGHLIVGNGCDDNPFLVKTSTKKLQHRLDRDPASFVFHLDATYQSGQAAYSVLVTGVSDKARYFHPVAAVIMSSFAARKLLVPSATCTKAL